MSKPAERPILFTGPMVRAILDGSKTQTRRVVKRPHIVTEAECFELADCWLDRDGNVWPADYEHLQDACPYGVPGDLLYVRETWQDWCPLWEGSWCGHGTKEGMAADHEVYYRADPPEAWKRGGPKKWRPSIHQPKWASRLWLRVTDVRVERVQDITNEDARAEGCPGGPHVDGYSEGNPADPYEEFAHLWDSINEKRGYGWNENPWTWAVTFERAEAP